MSLKKEMEIDYLNRRTKIKLPQRYSDFLELCKQTFYISESRSELMSFMYYDDKDEEDKIIEEDEYNNEDTRKAKFWKLIIDENEDEPEQIDVSSLEKKLIKTKKDIIEKAKASKKELYEYCSKIFEKEIKKRNENHKKNIESIQNEYINGLNEIKDDIGKQIKSNLEEMPTKVTEIYEKNIDVLNAGIKENLESQLNEFTQKCQKELNEINVKEIEDSIEKMKKNMNNCIYKLNAICEIDEKLEVKSTSTNLIKFKMNVTNKINKNLPQDCKVEIRDIKSKDEFSNNLDLSDIKPKESKIKEIEIRSSIKKKGNYKFTLSIKQNNQIISNVSSLNVNFVEKGTMSDLI